MAGHSVEEIKKETRIYRNVFLALGVFTIITVAIAQLDVSTGTAIALALFIATIKGSLVACYFMHLISERKLVYSVLVLTAIFFVALIALPLGSYFGSTAGA